MGALRLRRPKAAQRAEGSLLKGGKKAEEGEGWEEGAEMIVIFPSEKALPFEDGNGTPIWGHPFHPQAPCYCSQREDGKWTVFQDLQSRRVMDDVWVQSGTVTRTARLKIPPDMKWVWLLWNDGLAMGSARRTSLRPVPSSGETMVGAGLTTTPSLACSEPQRLRSRWPVSLAAGGLGIGEILSL